MCVIAVAGADLVRDKAPARWDTPRPRQLAAASPSFLLPPTPLKVMVCALPCWFFHQLLLHPWHTLLLAPPFLCPVPVMFCCSYNAQVFLLLHPWKVGQPQKLMH